MCGICGTVGLPLPETMTASLAHRGPDGQSGWSDDRCALGFRRLAILDLEGGMQPMADETGRYHLILNGEIYNHRVLRKELEGRGHKFRSNCDSEVVVHLYEEKGPDSVKLLRGMFAFAIWDSSEKALFMARDPLGKKPLVYWQVGEKFAFASEIQALLALDIPRDIDPAAIDAYLATGAVPGQLTMLKYVRKLPPGHWALFKSGRLALHGYRAPFPAPSPVTRGEAEERVRIEVTAAVDKRLESDVPLGAFLSGGIDSTIIAGLMAKKGPVKTFSIGFDDPAFDESGYARRVAEHFRTDHHAFTLGPDIAKELPRLVQHYGEPFADASALPTFALCRQTSQHVKVALSGEGGDECFGGYLRHRAIRMLAKLKGFPAPLRWAARLAPVDRKYKTRLKGLLSDLSRPLGALYSEMIAPFDPATREALRPGSRVRPAWFDEADPVASAGRHDLEHYLPDDLLVKVDIASMAHGLEVRCPFLDIDVVNYSQSLPGSLKIQGRVTKSILRGAFRSLLPPEVYSRSKQGFGVPMDEWLRGPLKALRDDHLAGSSFDRAVVQRLVSEHDRGVDHGRALWALIVFDAWERWLKNARAYPPDLSIK